MTHRIAAIPSLYPLANSRQPTRKPLHQKAAPGAKTGLGLRHSAGVRLAVEITS
jgi:hypothetical protein